MLSLLRTRINTMLRTTANVLEAGTLAEPEAPEIFGVPVPAMLLPPPPPPPPAPAPVTTQPIAIATSAPPPAETVVQVPTVSEPASAPAAPAPAPVGGILSRTIGLTQLPRDVREVMEAHLLGLENRITTPTPATVTATSPSSGSVSSSAPGAAAAPATSPAPSADAGQAMATRPISVGPLADSARPSIPTGSPSAVQLAADRELLPPAESGPTSSSGSALWLIGLGVLALLLLRR